MEKQMISREVVARTIRFQGAERLPQDFPEKFGSDIALLFMTPSPDHRPPRGADEWGVVCGNIGNSNLGQVIESPLKDWKDFARLNIPDILASKRWECLNEAITGAGDKFLLACGVSIYERVHFLRGQENTWRDICDAPAELGKLIDILTEMNVAAIKRFSEMGVDGYFIGDDWGSQDRLMVSPNAWREIWKPHYARIFTAAHDAGLFTFFHSCGHIVEILDDLIEIGLDVINMDQQETMGLELLGQRFGGRITFYCPVDIQTTMVHCNLDEIRAYCRKMARLLGRPEGGFIPKWYPDPVGAGHSQEAVDAMCDEFLRLGGARHGL